MAAAAGRIKTRALQERSIPASPYDRLARRLSKGLLRPFASIALNALYAPVPVAKFLFSAAGSQYGIGVWRKFWLLWKSLVSVVRVRGATSWREHIVLIQEVLSVPPSATGVVLEVGCYQGRSTVSLSWACALTKRRLVICDTFAGLPQPGSAETVLNLQSSEFTQYRTGQYCGTLEQVRNNVRRYGCLRSCEFVPGKAEVVLPARRDSYVMIFEDVDLPQVVEAIVSNTWERLELGCKFYTHEAPDYPIARLFFDRTWWQSNLGEDAPGLVGAGVGLPLGPDGSGLGFAVRRDTGS